jgi:hypothetical protein
MVTGCLDPNAFGCKDPVLPTVLPGGPVSGTILLAFDQTIRLERHAYNATLGIGARTTLTNATATIQIKDLNGNDATNHFFVLLTSDPLGATRGGTVPGATAVAWQLIPNGGAGGTLPQGTQYKVQARFGYTVAGRAEGRNIVPLQELRLNKWLGRRQLRRKRDDLRRLSKVLVGYQFRTPARDVEPVSGKAGFDTDCNLGVRLGPPRDSSIGQVPFGSKSIEVGSRNHALGASVLAHKDDC